LDALLHDIGLVHLSCNFDETGHPGEPRIRTRGVRNTHRLPGSLTLVFRLSTGICWECAGFPLLPYGWPHILDLNAPNMTFNLQPFLFSRSLLGYLCSYLRRIPIHQVCKGSPSAHTRKRKYSAIGNLWKILYLIIKIVEGLLSPPPHRQTICACVGMVLCTHLVIGGDRCN